MKRITIIAVSIAVITALVLGAIPAMAGKPTENGSGKNVVEWSNGFPSGPHYTLNTHGKKWEFKDCETCTEVPVSVLECGGSIFVPEYTLEGYPAQIHYVMNQKSNLDYLYVRDPCSFPSPGNENDPAIVQLPKGVYQVYARMLGKPGKPNAEGDPPQVVFYPKLVDACNAPDPEGDFGDAYECAEYTLRGLGVVTYNGGFTLEEGSLSRTALIRGNNKAENMTELFYWTGYVFDSWFDIDGDGEIELEDLEKFAAGISDGMGGYYSLLDLNADGFVNLDDRDLADPTDQPLYQDVITNYEGVTRNSNIPDLNKDGYVNFSDVNLDSDDDIDQDDFDLYLSYGTFYDNKWIFDIADMVIYGWDYENYGSKLVQVRFYPDTTDYIE